MNRPYLQYFILFTLLDCIFPFNSTDDSVKSQSSVETKRKASHQQTELHESTCFRTTIESIIKIANVNNVARDIGFFFLRKWSTSFESLKVYVLMSYVSMCIKTFAIFFIFLFL